MMAILLSFMPFILFVIIQSLMGVIVGLIAATLVSAVLLARNLVSPNKTIKVLDIGTVVLFGVLAVYACLSKATLPIPWVRLRVDAGLLLVMLVSIAIRKPFTLQYAREQVAPTLWDKPAFIRANYIITTVWALAFAVMVVTDLILLAVPRLPALVGIIATVVAIGSAARFTSWYPNRGRLE
jgi:hypothetical protein